MSFCYNKEVLKPLGGKDEKTYPLELTMKLLAFWFMEVNRDKSPFLTSYPWWISDAKIARGKIKHIRNKDLSKGGIETKHIISNDIPE